MPGKCATARCLSPFLNQARFCDGYACRAEICRTSDNPISSSSRLQRALATHPVGTVELKGGLRPPGNQFAELTAQPLASTLVGGEVDYLGFHRVNGT
jgi:hypothetical protein